MLTSKTIKQTGFTLIELLVVAPLVILLIGVMIGYISAVTGDGLKSQQQNSLAYETQAALDDIDTTTAKALSFKGSTPNLPVPQGPSDGAGSFASSGSVLVLEAIALTGNSSNDNRTQVYSEGTATSCDTSSAPYTYYTVYFLSSGTLYKRTVLSTSAKCAAVIPQQKNSCSPTIMQGTPPTSCQVEDEKLTDNVTSFDISYLNDAGAITTLANSTTINIKINAQKNVAGSLLTYTGSFRSKKQNSFLASTQAPAVTGSNLADPDNFICNWDQAANATSYTVSVRFGTDAPTISTESSGTFTKKIPITDKRGQKLECAVTANLTNGTTLAYAPRVLDPIPLWTDPTLENNWVRYDNYYAGAGFTKTASGMVVLKGLIKSGTAPARAFRLPPGYIPDKNLVFQQSSSTPTGSSSPDRVDVYADGSVMVQGTANGWISLAGINFMPSQYLSSFTSPTFSNGWTNYSPSSNDPNWQPAGYMQDTAGRTRTQGLIRAGTSTDPTLAFTLPTNLRPAEYEHIAAQNSGSLGVIGNVPANGINAKGGGSNFLETNTLTYPSSYSGWTNLTLQSSWVRYPGYTTPKFTKGSDGLVMLKGLIQSGSTGTYIATIPGNLKLCPKERHVYAVAAAGAYGRVDVEPGTATGGCGVSYQAGSNVWVSLDAISWIAEI
jgi:type II secretory pathway pseudopilin PulG